MANAKPAGGIRAGGGTATGSTSGADSGEPKKRRRRRRKPAGEAVPAADASDPS